MKEVEERRLSINTAHHMRRQGWSQMEFLDAVDNSKFHPEDVNDALWALKERGELEHLVTWVWTYRRR